MSSLDEILAKRNKNLGSQVGKVNEVDPLALRGASIDKPRYAPGQGRPDRMNRPERMGGQGVVADRGGTQPQSRFDQGVQSDGNPFKGQQGYTLNQQMNRSTEERLVDFGVSASKQTYGYLKELMSALKLTDPVFWFDSCKISSKAGLGVAGVGLLFSLFGFKMWLFVFAGLFLTAFAAIGALVLKGSAKKFKDNLAKKGVDYYTEYIPKKWGIEGEVVEPVEEEPEPEVVDEPEVVEEVKPEPKPEPKPVVKDEVIGVGEGVHDKLLSNVDDIPTGFYSRQFLYDSYVHALTKINLDYKKARTLSESDPVFREYVDFVYQASDVLGLTDLSDTSSEAPQVLSVTRKPLIDFIELSRGKKVGLKQFVEEFQALVSFDKKEGRPDPSVMVNAYTVGKTIKMEVFRGASLNVSVGSVLESEKEFFLDSKNIIPVAFGFGKEGMPFLVDLRRVESMIIAGMPRSGKSWLAKSIISQMVAFNSPDDLNFVFCDTKGRTSDLYDLQRLPHAKGFYSTPESILKALGDVVEFEAKEREEKIGNAGCLDIWEYREKNPEDKLPVLYVVIDEMIDLKVQLEQLGKTELKEYYGYLTSMITRFPNLGIRFMGVPHHVKHEYFPKTASGSVTFKVSVRGDKDHVDTTTGVPLKDFSLVSPGDMAIISPETNGNLEFSHSFILDDSNAGYSKVFDYQINFWNKLSGQYDKVSSSSSNNQVQAKKVDAPVEQVESGANMFDSLF